MSSNVEVPSLGESITEAVLLSWLKKEGDFVAVDEPLCELESDKATVELPAPVGGVLHQIKPAGETARVGEVIAKIDEAEARADNKPPSAKIPIVPEPTQPRPKAPPPPKTEKPPPRKPTKAEPIKAEPTVAEPTVAEPMLEEPPDTGPSAPSTRPQPPGSEGARREPMSKIRRSIAERLVRAQHTAAMLTTFNEIDMTAVQELRARNQERFKEVYGVSLGLMSFFARAASIALKHFPGLNAQIDGSDIVYHDHVHLGIAVSTDRGLVVPVLHDAESMSFAQIEQSIKRAASAARDGKLSIAELSGGTFTITNGGVFGSLLSTPILNPPQTGILGMHAIQDRPVAVNRQVEIRPMMYVALTYDHRLVDGHDSVSFLVRLKHLLEEPLQMLLEI